ncbi:DUF5667 domain-containing protein [Amycolatopsis nigrescens]|uniref:DUF5667 domain-containing protein n=1 Tax=Amycolatopsis nigrescens TaxID=381445 RepID=UPI0003745D23|nr:DUF5667 domain-containing protein [Amycolatopsis nigrescens]
MNLPGWSPRERAERDRFARAVERGLVDPATGSEPEDAELNRQLAVVGALRATGASLSPDEAARHRIHLGVTERLEAETEPGPAGRGRPRLAGLVAAAVTLLVALGGLGMLLSGSALPGDTLYDVKRAGETAALGLTFGDQAKAFKQLEFATGRLDELGELRETGAGDDAYRIALDDFDRDASAGVRRLNELMVDTGGQQLGELRVWVLAQTGKLAVVRPEIPPSALARYRTSYALLGRIDDRLTALAGRLGCYRITSGESDDLGALPAGGPCEPQPGAGQPLDRGQPPPATESSPDPDLRNVSVHPTSSMPLTSPETTTPATTAPGTPTTTTPSSAQPVAVAPPIVSPTGPRLPDSPPSPRPLLSIPPLVPGLPGIGVG